MCLSGNMRLFGETGDIYFPVRVPICLKSASRWANIGKTLFPALPTHCPNTCNGKQPKT